VNKIFRGDWIECLQDVPSNSVQCCVTSPPYYGLRDYKVNGQLGLEKTPEEYVEKLATGLTEQVYRVLRHDGTLWLNLGDVSASAAAKWGGNPGGYPCKQDTNRGSKRRAKIDLPDHIGHKEILGIPWQVAFALQKRGWYLRTDIIWSKPNPMPESCVDRPTKSHEYIFLLTKGPHYFYDHVAIMEPCSGTANARGKGVNPKANGRNSGINPASSTWQTKQNASWSEACIGLVTTRNKRSVWTVPSFPYKGAHHATFPPDLIKPCILAGTSARGACASCGAPWKRVLEKAERVRMKNGYNSPKSMLMGNGTGENSMLRDGEVQQYKTLGWEKTCECDDISTVPCTVLDPFLGSGTTAFVCMELARDCIGIELNPEYHSLIQQRTNVTPGFCLA
jgi:DNA modification methylase